jgi:hypothetical protein
MTSSFIVKVRDRLHRIYIEKEVWNTEDIEIGDYIEVTIKKLKRN